MIHTRLAVSTSLANTFLTDKMKNSSTNTAPKGKIPEISELQYTLIKAEHDILSDAA